MQIATDLYAGLQNFHALYTHLQERPLFITGESYAGKYVPVIGVLQVVGLICIVVCSNVPEHLSGSCKSSNGK